MEKKYEFTTKDWVLVRNADNMVWRLSIFSHYTPYGDHVCISGCYNQCIPYEGNEELLSTTDKPKEKRWKPEYGEKYWTLNFISDQQIFVVIQYSWNDFDYERCLLKQGVVFKTKETANVIAEKRNDAIGNIK